MYLSVRYVFHWFYRVKFGGGTMVPSLFSFLVFVFLWRFCLFDDLHSSSVPKALLFFIRCINVNVLPKVGR